MSIRGVLLSALAVISIPFAAVASDAELQRFQGRWEVIELVEDGHVIPGHSLPYWLPSGGRVEIVDDAIISVSSDTNRKELKIFSIDPAQYPKGIEIRTRDKREIWGIYRFDADRLVVCLVDHEDGNRPDGFFGPSGLETNADDSPVRGSKKCLISLQQLDVTLRMMPDTGDEFDTTWQLDEVIARPKFKCFRLRDRLFL